MAADAARYSRKPDKKVIKTKEESDSIFDKITVG